MALVLSALHVLALGIGLGSVFMRGRFLRALRAGPDPRALDGLFAADTLWGVAAALWLLTGLARAFGHVEKAPEFYLRNGSSCPSSRSRSGRWSRSSAGGARGGGAGHCPASIASRVWFSWMT